MCTKLSELQAMPSLQWGFFFFFGLFTDLRERESSHRGRGVRKREHLKQPPPLRAELGPVSIPEPDHDLSQYQECQLLNRLSHQGAPLQYCDLLLWAPIHTQSGRKSLRLCLHRRPECPFFITNFVVTGPNYPVSPR